MQLQRQIFFCSLGGFHTHTGELEAHNALYPELSQAINPYGVFLVDWFGVDPSKLIPNSVELQRTKESIHLLLVIETKFRFKRLLKEVSG